MSEHSVNTKILPEEFNVWRQSSNEFAASVCLLANKMFWEAEFQSDKVANEKLKKLRYFPLALARITRQMCECEEVCTQVSLARLRLIQCHVYVIKNLLTNDDYFQSEFVGKKVINGTLVDLNFPVNELDLKNDLKREIRDLCDNKKDSLRKLKCKAYELKDFCREDSSCFYAFTDTIMPPNFRTCANTNFSTDLDNIGYKIGNPMILKQVRVSREVKDISSAACIRSTSYMTVIISCVLLGIMYLKYSGPRKLVVMGILALLGIGWTLNF